jgi:hypothetical protein
MYANKNVKKKEKDRMMELADKDFKTSIKICSHTKTFKGKYEKCNT